MKQYIFLSFMCLMMAGTADARQMGGHAGSMGGGGGMKGCAMMGGGMTGGHGKMGGGMMGGQGMMGGRGGGMHGVMGAFHHWITRVMRHSDPLNLSSDQIDRVGELSAAHAKSATDIRAKYQILNIDFKQVLRQKTVDMKAVEKILKKQADLHVSMQKEGVVFYTQVLALLTAEQKSVLWETVGSPFPYHWEKRHRGHHRQETHRWPSPDDRSTPSGKKNKS